MGCPDYSDIDYYLLYFVLGLFGIEFVSLAYSLCTKCHVITEGVDVETA